MCMFCEGNESCLCACIVKGMRAAVCMCHSKEGCLFVCIYHQDVVVEIKIA